MSNTRIRYHRRINTRPLLPFVLSPEVTRRMTLEDDEEEIEDSEGDHGCRGDVDDLLMQWLDAYPEEEDGNGQPDEERCDGVEDLAEEPVVEGFWDVGWWNVCYMAASTVMYTCR